ncbi:MAG: RecQ family ATP-dependent DNA helicase [Sphaerochaetaceae bacterium]|nr:RecQ family ATP-dependent DNA helicase [Sphaerochaetaceae bacterium]
MEEPLGSMLVDDPVAVLAKERFGIEYLFPLQRMAVAGVLDGIEREEPVRQMILFPTGFGKSLCFQLPALLAPGPSLVVYPLLALMNDQRRSLEKRGIPCVVFRGGMEEGERKKGIAALRDGSVKIGITNPECLSSPGLATLVDSLDVFHLAIDEAHCVSEWGESFRPAYLRLGDCIQRIQPKVVSAFTATASPQVGEAIARYLFGDSGYSLITADMDKPNIYYAVELSVSPRHSLIKLIRRLPRPLIVFDQSRPGVRLLCEFLHSRGIGEAKFYHAGLSREEKEAVEAWFMKSEDGILVSTCAYGMGVDKKNIRSVVHYSAPPSVEAYIQESGRAGRDGEKAQAVLIKDIWKEDPGSRALGLAARKPEEVQGNLHDTRADFPPGEKAGSETLSADKLPAEKLSLAAAAREVRKKAFMEYGKSLLCRRASLLALMGGALDSPCSGCDVCDGSAAAEAEGLAALGRFFAFNRFRFERGQSLRLLGEAAPGAAPPDPAFPRPSLGQPPACPGAGLLSAWDREEIEALLAAALSRGILKQGSRLYGKKRLGLAGRGKL